MISGIDLGKLSISLETLYCNKERFNQIELPFLPVELTRIAWILGYQNIDGMACTRCEFRRI